MHHPVLQQLRDVRRSGHYGARTFSRLGITAAAVAMILTVPAVAVASPPPAIPKTPTPLDSSHPSNTGEPVSALRQEVQTGSLLHTHGTVAACPRCEARVVTAGVGDTTPLRAASPAGYAPADLSNDLGINSGVLM